MIGDSEGNSYETDVDHALGRKSEQVATAISPDIDPPPPITNYDWLKEEEKDMQNRQNLPPDFVPPETITPDKEREAVIIRHGDTKFTENDKAHGWSKEHLSQEGKEEMEKIRLKNKPDILISSDLPRTKQSAEIVSKNHDIPLVGTEEGLRTWDIGDIQGMDCRHADNILQHYVNNPGVEVPGGESFNDFKTRVLGTVEDLMGKYPDMKIGFVTHSKVQRLLNAAEEDGWNSISADHFNNAPESPGKEKTMKLGFADLLPDLLPEPTDEELDRIKAEPGKDPDRIARIRQKDKDLKLMHDLGTGFKNTDFNKFEREARPSTNIEDDRSRGVNIFDSDEVTARLQDMIDGGIKITMDKIGLK